MSRTTRHNRKPSKGKRSIDSRGQPYVFRATPAVCHDGKAERFPFKENGDIRRWTVRIHKAKCKAAIIRGSELPLPPKTQGWESW